MWIIEDLDRHAFIAAGTRVWGSGASMGTSLFMRDINRADKGDHWAFVPRWRDGCAGAARFLNPRSHEADAVIMKALRHRRSAR